jgi:hypothetical protein
MRVVAAQDVAEVRERRLRARAPMVIDLTDVRPLVVDEEFVVEWQISDEHERLREAPRASVSRH